MPSKDRSQRHDIRWRGYRESEISMRASSDIEQTINSHGDAVWRACLVYLAPSEAEDAFQNTFMKYALCDKLFNDEEHKSMAFASGDKYLQRRAQGGKEKRRFA